MRPAKDFDYSKIYTCTCHNDEVDIRQWASDELGEDGLPIYHVHFFCRSNGSTELAEDHVVETVRE